MFENLANKLENIFSKLKKAPSLNEEQVESGLKEIRQALLEADVALPVAKQFIENIKPKAIGQEIIRSTSPGQMIVKIVNDELVNILGGKNQELNFNAVPPVTFLLVGLQGSGKTTFSAKLANYLLAKKQLKPLLVACDVYRPAAIDQLEVIAESISVPVYKNLDENNPVKIAQMGVAQAKKEGKNLVIIDTAGRLSVDQNMMKEIESIKDTVQPSEILFVVDAMTGQDAVNTAKTFHDVLNYDGVVLTKLDGDTRGGAALTITNEVNKPIKFISTGEKMNAIDVFHPNRMADRILGMGDVVSLVEKAQAQFDEKEAREMERKMLKNKFTFNDFLKQIKQIKKMGNLKDLLGMVPGIGKAIRNMDIDDDAFKGIESIIFSMTEDERNNPKIIDSSRRKRIANGSGSQIEDVNKLIKQFSQMGKMMKMMKNGGLDNMMKNLGGNMPNFK